MMPKGKFIAKILENTILRDSQDVKATKTDVITMAWLMLSHIINNFIESFPT